MLVIRCMLSTIDNPYNPFDDWDRWYAFDNLKGYHTPGYLARIAHPSDQLSDNDNALELCDSIDLIVEENVLGIYIKVEKEVSE